MYISNQEEDEEYEDEEEEDDASSAYDDSAQNNTYKVNHEFRDDMDDAAKYKFTEALVWRSSREVESMLLSLLQQLVMHECEQRAFQIEGQ